MSSMCGDDDGRDDEPKYDSKEIAAKAYEQYAEKAKVRDHQKNRDQFWRDVMCSLWSGPSVGSWDQLTEAADKVLAMYDERFNPNTGSKV